MTETVEFKYQINASEDSLTRTNPVTSADTVLYASGFYRYHQFDLYIEGQEEDGPVIQVDLSETDSFVAVPSRSDYSEYEEFVQ